MKYGVDFTIEPIPKRHGHKGRVKPFRAIVIDMETAKQFKNPESIREYWRRCKQRERARSEKAKNG